MARIQKKKSVKIKKSKEKGLNQESGSTARDSLSSKSKPAAFSEPVKKKPEKKQVAAKPKEPNVFQKAIEFLTEVQIELKKVTWPTRKQTTGTTIVVIIFVFIVSAFLGIFDLGLSKLVQVVLT